MRNQSPYILVVGSDGVIGAALMTHLQYAGKDVVGTTRRREAVDDAHVYLDLADELDGWRAPWPVAAAVICAGATELEACRRDPVATARVNVCGVTTLVNDLVARGAFVVYLSSNQVFDGSTSHCGPDDPLSPVTEYGRQKAEAERRIGKWCDSVAIVRLTKVLGPSNRLFVEWSAAMRNSRVIRPFRDMVMAPVPLSTVVSVLRSVVNRRLSGVLQLSGASDISYAEAARLGASLLGASPSLIQPVEAALLDLFSEPLPAHTTLSVERLISELGIEPPDVRRTVGAAFTNPQMLAPPVGEH